MAFSVEHEEFSGPLALLLELIDEQKLEIRDVSLAKVADGFLKYIEEQDVPSDELADFLIVASRLIYLKSRELMPFLRIDEEDAAAAKLEDHLRVYQEFVAAAALLEERYMKAPMFLRDAGKAMRMRAPQPLREETLPKNVTINGLHDAFLSVLRRLEPFFALQHTSIERIKSVEERIDELKSAIATRAHMRFRDVVAGAGSKVEIVVSFLALLELLRRKHIRAEQKHHGADIELHEIPVV